MYEYDRSIDKRDVGYPRTRGYDNEPDWPPGLDGLSDLSLIPRRNDVVRVAQHCEHDFMIGEVAKDSGSRVGTLTKWKHQVDLGSANTGDPKPGPNIYQTCF